MAGIDKATPRPWFVVEREPTYWTGRKTFDVSSGTEDSGYKTVIGNEGLWDDEETDKANAELIVAAVNAYDQLIADREVSLRALKKIQHICTSEGHAPCRNGGISDGEVVPNTCICDWPEWIKPIAEAAIAQVEAHK